MSFQSIFNEAMASPNFTARQKLRISEVQELVDMGLYEIAYSYLMNTIQRCEDEQRGEVPNICEMINDVAGVHDED